jgi:hypothetical protein
MRSKYNAKKTLFDGVMYDSKAEAKYAQQLDILRKAMGDDRVIEVVRQPKYLIEVNGKKICTYIGDFLVTYSNGNKALIDVKSAMTKKLPVYRIKKKLMLAVHGIEIIEVK